MTTTLQAYGWDEQWQAAFSALATGEAVPARVARVDRGACTAVGQARSYRVQLLPRTEWPVTGDWIAVRPDASEQELDQLAAVLPRRKALRRLDPDERGAQVVAANVDAVLVFQPLDRPVKEGLRDRLLVLAADAGARPLLMLTKADLVDDATRAALVADAVAGLAQVLVSTVSGEGIDAVRAAVAPGETAVLLGPSGAGKSTLANALLGETTQRTGEVREQDRKGRHTTTARELLPLPWGAVLIDTPGLRAVGLWEAEEGVEQAFGDITELAANCRFADCAHEREPGCAVGAAVDAGELSAERVERWRGLVRELEAAERRRLEAGWRRGEGRRPTGRRRGRG